MADVLETLQGFAALILGNQLYFLLTIGVFSLFVILLVAHRIHKIHSEDIFVHQAWGAKWKGR